MRLRYDRRRDRLSAVEVLSVSPDSPVSISSSSVLPAAVLRAQQYATRLAFLVSGVAVAVWAPLVPFAKARAGLDEGGLGLLLLCLGMGSILAMPMAGALAARLGCRKVLVGAVALIGLMLPLLAWASTWWLLAGALFVFGAGAGALDCAMNLLAVAVERDSERPMMSGFHGLYSVGGLLGATAMSGLLSLGLVPLAACGVMLLLMVGCTVWAAPHWRQERAAGAHGPAFQLPRGGVLFIGLLCLACFLVEGAMLDWSAVFLADLRGMPAAQAGLGFALFSATMALGRLTGDAVIQRLGQRRAVLGGGLVAGAGLLLIVLVPHAGLALLGHALVGLGCANVVPVMFSLAGRHPDMPPSVSIPAITTLGYAGVLMGPALIGFVAHASSLQAAFMGLAVLMLGVAASARRL